MEGPLLRVFFFLLASRGGSGQLLGALCYFPKKGPGSHMAAYYCPGFQDHPNARFCCGTCSKPFCCSSRENSLDATRCPAFDPVPEATTPTTPLLGDDRMNILWCFIGIFVGSLIVLGLCHSCRVLKCLRFCGNYEEEEEEEEEMEMEERRSPVPPPPILLPPPSPPRYIDYPPPYSAVDPLASLPVSVTNAPLRMGASRAQLRGAEGGVPAQLRGADDGSPPRLRGAEGGARSRLRGIEWGIPAGFHEAEWGDPPPPYPGDPPPYSDIDLFASPSMLPPVTSAARRKRRAKARGSMRRAPAEPAGAVGGAPDEASGAAAGGAPAEPSGAVGGAPDEASGTAGGAPAEPSGAVGGAPDEASGTAAGGAPAEPSGAVGGAPDEASGTAAGGAPAEPSGAVGGAPDETSGATAGGAEGGAFAM